ncbi:MAG: HDOD domain-containing protein [Fibrobacteria bacterium]|nr:HDOD domain-containing protein [Fibrobacteria bacterium]
MNRDGILAALRGEINLPPLPEVLARLDACLADPEVDVREVAKVIMTDSVLSGQMIRMANSVYYRRNGSEVASVSSALQRLGLRMARGLVYALSLPGLFGGRSIPFQKPLWRHSLSVAAFSSSLWDLVGGASNEREVPYFCGLVHDVGALVMGTIDPGYADFLRQAASGRETGSWDERDLGGWEMDRYGIHHAEVGGIFLAERWKVPGIVARVVASHHDPDWLSSADDETTRRLVAILQVADGVCSHSGFGWDGLPASGRAFNEGAWEFLGLELSAVDAIMAHMASSVVHAELLLS